MKTQQSPIINQIGTWYNTKLDELKVFTVEDNKPIIYIQQFSKKFPGSPEMSLELLIWLAVNYEEVALAI